MKNLLYTFEEYYTLLVEIEGILNSRPLTTSSSDPNDLEPLTLAHFLIGNSLQKIPEWDYRDVNDNHLSRWQHIQKLREQFWLREYLQQLQSRTRWKEGEDTTRVGDLVFIIKDNLSLLRWKFGSVEELHPGDDGLVRVIIIHTPTRNYKRAIKKICALPYKD